MSGVYKVIEVIGTSPESWEKAAAAAVETAAKTLDDLRIGEVKDLDLQIENGKVIAYRVKLSVSFKYHEEMTREAGGPGTFGTSGHGPGTSGRK